MKKELPSQEKISSQELIDYSQKFISDIDQILSNFDFYQRYLKGEYSDNEKRFRRNRINFVSSIKKDIFYYRIMNVIDEEHSNHFKSHELKRFKTNKNQEEGMTITFFYPDFESDIPTRARISTFQCQKDGKVIVKENNREAIKNITNLINLL